MGKKVKMLYEVRRNYGSQEETQGSFASRREAIDFIRSLDPSSTPILNPHGLAESFESGDKMYTYRIVPRMMLNEENIRPA